MKVRLIVIAIVMAVLGALFVFNVGNANAATPSQHKLMSNVYMDLYRVSDANGFTNTYRLESYYYDVKTEQMLPCTKKLCGTIVLRKHSAKLLMSQGEQIVPRYSSYGYANKHMNVFDRYHGETLPRTTTKLVKGKRLTLQYLSVSLFNPKFGVPKTSLRGK